MIYMALEVIQIFGAEGRTNEQTNEGVPRGPRGRKNILLTIYASAADTLMHYSGELPTIYLKINRKCTNCSEVKFVKLGEERQPQTSLFRCSDKKGQIVGDKGTQTYND